MASTSALATRARRGPMDEVDMGGRRKTQMDPITRTLSPIVTGTSILAIKYRDGVMMAGDTLGSYGSLARFKEVRRIVAAGKETLVAADGDISDFQYIEDFLKEMEVDEKCIGDGLTRSAKEIFSRMTNLLYFRRTKINPLWNNLVVGGLVDGNPFLGTTDKIGTAYEADYVATGIGLHLAMPLLRKEWKPNMTEAQARELLSNCMRVLFYRDCRTINKITFASATAGGPVVEEPVVLETEWSYKLFEFPSGIVPPS